MKKTLKLRYSKKENDLVCSFPDAADGSLVLSHLCSDVLKWGGLKNVDKGGFNYEVTNFIKDLENRGYDIKTLKFSIQKCK